jgi:hypothetical protein
LPFHHGSFLRSFSIVLVLLLSLSCSLFTSSNRGERSAQKPPEEQSGTEPQELTLATTIPSKPLPTAVELPTQVLEPVSVDNIQVYYLYTSELITIIYPLYGSLLDDFVTATITNTNQTPVKVVMTSEIEGFTNQAIDTVEIAPSESVEVRQNPLLIPEVIDQLNVGKPAQFHIHISYLENGVEKDILEETQETFVYARRDFPWSIQGFTDPEIFDLMASMVTPNDPSVEALIRTAADHTQSGIMWSGYGGHLNDEEGGVWERLEALWKAEEDNHITYISTMVSFAPGSVQRIRLPYEVMDQQSGNCIELVLLYASAAEALGLEPAIIGIPGHAFLGVRTDDQNANYYFVETTLIGRASFAEAVDMGNQEFEETLPHLDAGESGYGWVSILDTRQKGILPLPWH